MLKQELFKGMLAGYGAFCIVSLISYYTNVHYLWFSLPFYFIFAFTIKSKLDTLFEEISNTKVTSTIKV